MSGFKSKLFDSDTSIVSAEVWKAIAGYPDYQVSDQGRVKSLKWGKERILRTNSGPSVGVMLSRGGVVSHRQVRLLVLNAFVGPPPARARAVHLDGDQFNNRVNNLAWFTPGSDARSKADE